MTLSAMSVCLMAGAAERTKAEDYPVRAEAGGVTLAAEFLYRSVPSSAGNLLLRDHIVVEVAAFGADGRSLKLSAGQFSLRLTRKALPQSPVPSQVVAAHQRQRDPFLSSARPEGADPVVIGPPASPRFPGDPRAQGPPILTQPDLRPEGAERAPEPDIAELLDRAALPDGEQPLPVRGCLYFPYSGKMKKLKGLQLLYTGPEGEAALDLN